jgi:hypothetical protein
MKRSSVFLAIFLLTVTQGAAAPEQGYYFRNKTSLGLTIPFATLGSDFAGQGTVYSDVLTANLSSGQSTSGLGILVGRSLDDEEHLSGLLNYMISTTLGNDQAGIPFSNTLHILTLDLRYEFFTERRIRPFALTGLNLDRITATGAPGTSGNYSGYGWDLGGGVAFYPYRRFAITASIIYRLIRFYQTSGTTYTTPSLVTNGVNFYLGVEYAFKTEVACPYRINQ